MTGAHADRAEGFAAKADEAMWAALDVMDSFTEQDEWSDALTRRHRRAVLLAWAKVHAIQGQAQIHAMLALLDSMAARV
ncbi:hypothetical protein AB0L97_34870 [Nocardia sp. NPDC051911]|uniref:hypothetical protein n=1 Tax=Nocardia sp. NPDC051911 TaxID=3154648 RepID=UPI003435B452